MKWGSLISFHVGTIATEIAILLYTTGEKMFDSTMQPQIIYFVCGKLCPENQTLCERLGNFPEMENQVQAMASKYLMAYRVLVNAPAILLGLFCGAWSDKFGRKLPMTIPNIGSILAALLCALIKYFPEYALELCLFGAAALGAMGNACVMSMAVTSYISDVSKKEDRTRKLGQLMAMFFLGIFTGNLLAGFVLKVSDFTFGMYVVIALHITVIAVVGVLIPESVVCDKDGKKHEMCKGIFAISNVFESISVLIKYRANGTRRIILVVFSIAIMKQMCIVGERDVLVLFLARSPLSWPTSGFGFLQAFITGGLGISFLLLLPLLTSVFKVSDTKLLIVCLILRSIRVVWLTFCAKTWMIFPYAFIGVFSGLSASPIKSLLSKSVDENELGKVFALLSSSETALQALGAICFTTVYGATVHVFQGFVFLVDCAFWVFMLFGSIWLHLEVTKMNTDKTDIPINSHDGLLPLREKRENKQP